MALPSMTNGLNNTVTAHSRTLLQCFIANQDALKGFFCKAVAERADADDLFQKLLLKALNSEHLDPIDNPLAYGYRMAQHLVIDHHREQKKMSPRLSMSSVLRSISVFCHKCQHCVETCLFGVGLKAKLVLRSQAVWGSLKKR